MIELLREEIFRQLMNTDRSEIGNLIFNLIQYHMEYNSDLDKFEIDLNKVPTSYFEEHPNIIGGAIKGTSINWDIDNEKFIVWLTSLNN